MVLGHGLDSSGQHLDVFLRSRMKHIQSELVLFPPNMCPLPKARKFSFPPSPNPCWAAPPPQCLRKPLCPPHAIAPGWAQDTCYCSWLDTGHILLLLAGAQDTFYCSWLGAGSPYSLPGTRPLPLAFWSSNLHPTWWPNVSFLNARLVIPSLPWLSSMRLRAFCHFIIIYLFLLAVPGLHCCPAYSPAAGCRLPIGVASLVVEDRL